MSANAGYCPEGPALHRIVISPWEVTNPLFLLNCQTEN